MEKSKVIEEWKNKNLKNYLKKHGDDSLERSDIDHIFDWLNSDDAKRHRKRLFRLAVPDALKLSKLWTQKLNKKYLKIKEKDQDLKGVEIVKTFQNGNYIVRLVDENSYIREGNLMGHCVGGYFNYNCIIFSLRDKTNAPHCTIEYDPKNQIIEQIKGKGNKAVIDKYHNDLIDFFNSLEISHFNKYDLEHINASSFGSFLFKTNHPPLSFSCNKKLIVEKTSLTHTFKNIKINGDLIIKNLHQVKWLCDTLIINGDLLIEYMPPMLRLCNKLVVYGDVELINCKHTKILAKELEIHGDVLIEDCPNFRINTVKCNGELCHDF